MYVIFTFHLFAHSTKWNNFINLILELKNNINGISFNSNLLKFN